jgi:hypothetical protein
MPFIYSIAMYILDSEQCLVLGWKAFRVRHLPSYIPYLQRNSNGMVTTDLIQVGTYDLVEDLWFIVFQSKFDFFKQVFGLGWLFMSAEGINSLADFKLNSHI